MKRIYSWLLLSSFLFSCGQAPKTDKQIIQETMQAIEIPKQYQQEPFYYAGIYSANI
ncbi:hypothetical protein GQ592_11610, partial [Gilliamella sp. Lep-s21]|nr:hypothetical protein [Gilliamella sp. Lep-s35]MWP70107.1 hypothetical protein [Gilliamella sp. Lep-s5]MWP78340.1 hypothetical protein [Gilliamella sp. Lep-s21]